MLRAETEREQTIRSLYHRYAGAIFDRCVRILGDSGDAEDAVQEIFIRADRQLEAAADPGINFGWLYRVASNVSIDMFRTRRRRPADPQTDRLPELAVAPGDPERQLQMRRVLNQLFLELADRDLEILVSHFIDGMPQGEIADHLGISRRAVVKRLSRIRDRVGRMLQGDVGDG